MNSDRAIQKSAFNQFWCDVVCRWEKRGGHTLAWYKRHSNRVARRRLARELKREVEDATS
jgi:hypothetical protein